MSAAAARHTVLPAWLHRLVAAAGIALLLVLSVLAASPQLHEWLHPDAGQPGHVCAITLFQHGVAQAAVAVVPVAATLRWVTRRPACPAGPDLIAPRFRLIPGRAPPGR